MLLVIVHLVLISLSLQRSIFLSSRIFYELFFQKKLLCFLSSFSLCFSGSFSLLFGDVFWGLFDELVDQVKQSFILIDHVKLLDLVLNDSCSRILNLILIWFASYFKMVHYELEILCSRFDSFSWRPSFDFVVFGRASLSL